MTEPPSGKRPRELSANDKGILRTEKAINAMMATDGWKIYVHALSAMLQSQRNAFEAPAEATLDGIAQVLRAESAKGSIMGIRLALELPQGMLTDAANLRTQKGLTSSAEDDE